MDEIFLPIPGYEDHYEISNCGTVRTIKSGHGTYVGRIRKFNVTKKGYALVKLSKDGKEHTFTVHSLVCLAFIGPRPEGYHINHKNGNKLDNRLENLEYCTPSDSMKHSYDVLNRYKPVGSETKWAKLTENDIINIRDMYKNGFTQLEISKKFNTGRRNVSDIVNKHTWRHV